MKTKILLRTTFTLVLGLLITVTNASGQQVRYRVIDLGEDSTANDLTDSGQIAGSKNFGGTFRHAAFWPNRHSLPIDLGTLPGDVGSKGFSINPRGQIVGQGFPPDFSVVRPLFWANSQSGPIELPGLAAGFNRAADINPAGQIVGQFVPLDDSGVWPVFWSNSNTPAIYLPLVSNQFPNGVAVSINGRGSILGDACTADFAECHAAFWANSTSTPVALASPGGDFIYTDIGLTTDFVFAHALNNAGRMVGFAYNADGSQNRAVYWASSSSPAVILSTTGDFPNGDGQGINDERQIVGTAYNSDFSASHAFFWPSPTSQGIDLNTVIPPGSGLELILARSINNRGEISGGAYLNGEPPGHAVVLVPIPRH
jgi:uncharacterized membrane protein